MLALALTVAIVTHGPTPLAASTGARPARQATLWRGDWLEVRGERQGRLKVYDHRHERPGYVEPWQVRRYTVDGSAAPALRAVIDFLRDQPGAESLGIGYVALYLKVAPSAAIGPDVLDALGTMADRLARRVSRGARAEELEVAESYGLRFQTLETDGRVRVCYDGDAFRRVLVLAGASPEARARAALGLTDPRCAPPEPTPAETQALVERSLATLAGVTGAPALLQNRLRLRRVGLDATLAWLRARHGEAEAAAQASARALDAFAGVDRAELAVEDDAAWQEAAVRVAAARWLRSPAVRPRPAAGARLELSAGEPGETCVRLVEGKTVRVERCTHGLVFPQSLRRGPRGRSLAIAVQLLPGWVEQWLFHRAGDGWIVDPIVPGETDPGLGYVELAGFSPDGKRVLVVREARGERGLRRSFEVRRVATLAVEHIARAPGVLLAFRRWSAPEWRRATVALR